MTGIGGLPIKAECQGINFKDIKFSPGGTALPDKCMPYDPLSNNPYAVRCIDAWPGYKSGYPGDQYCILPPPPDKGVQYGYHPQGTGMEWAEQAAVGNMDGYKNLAGTNWETPVDGESNTNYIGGADNPEARNYYRAYIRMRAGSHHMINSIAMGGTRGTWSAGSAGGLQLGSLSLPSTERPDENWPNALEKPPEDAGLYRKFPAKPNITFNVHNFNATDAPLLRESWTNLWWEDDAKVEMQFISDVPPSQTILLPGVSPGMERDLHYSYANFTKPTRILELFGHRHAWNANFSAWIKRPGSTELQVVYQSFDWVDQPTYRYDSYSKNPVQDAPKHISGGHTGILTMMPGEELHFNCHIVYTAERAAQIGVDAPTGNLKFANEALDAEMCILFGWADADVGSPRDETTPLPDFATID